VETVTDELKVRLDSARLYLVSGPTDDDSLDAALRGGVDILQLSHPRTASNEEIVTTGRRFREIAARYGVPLLLNGRADLVEACAADGVHLNADDGAVAEARSALGPQRIVGLWTKNEAEVDHATSLDLDYISVGPISATPTLAGRPATGTELAAYAASHSSVPVFAIGGIDPTNVARVLATGLIRVAVLRVIAEAADPEQTAAQLKAALPE
jgi:thiamine-phosphate pyrophosphorylase